MEKEIIPNLQKKVITDKNGHRKTVFVRNDAVNKKTSGTNNSVSTEKKGELNVYKNSNGSIKQNEVFKANIPAFPGVSEWKVEKLVKNSSGIPVAILKGKLSVKPGKYKVSIKVSSGKDEWKNRTALVDYTKTPQIVTGDLDEIIKLKNSFNENEVRKLEPFTDEDK